MCLCQHDNGVCVYRIKSQAVIFHACQSNTVASFIYFSGGSKERDSAMEVSASERETEHWQHLMKSFGIIKIRNTSRRERVRPFSRLPFLILFCLDCSKKTRKKALLC